MRYIVSAAQRNSIGRVIMSVRHMDFVFWRNVLDLPEDELLPRHAGLPDEVKLWQGCEQGFVDNYGVFLTREQAWPIALEAGQILKKELELGWQRGCLHSEHLY